MEVRNKVKKIHVVTVIDESGSMNSARKFAVDALNETVQEHRKESKIDGTEVNFSLISFNTNISEHFWERPMDKVAEIKPEDYRPNGWTALYDSIGKALSKANETIQNYDSIIVHIITDGQENISKEYNIITLKNIVDELNKTQKFNITFMGCDKDYVNQVAKQGLGLADGNINCVTPQDYTSGKSFATHTAGIKNFRSSVSQGQNLVSDYYNNG